MTEAEDTAGKDARNDPLKDSPARRRHNEQLATARAILATLDNGQLAEVLLAEFDQRRLDAERNPIPDRDGLYEATANAMLALLGLSPVQGMAAKLAAVGNGALIYGKDQDTAGEIRWLSLWVEAFSSAVNNPDPVGLARTLEKRYSRNVSAEATTRALAHQSHTRRVTELALAAGVLQSDNPMSSDYWRKPHDRVRDFLKRK